MPIKPHPEEYCSTAVATGTHRVKYGAQHGPQGSDASLHEVGAVPMPKGRAYQNDYYYYYYYS
jgi:hypothetical protein